MPQKTVPSEGVNAVKEVENAKPRYSVDDFLRNVRNLKIRSDPGIDYDPRIVSDKFKALSGPMSAGLAGYVASSVPTLMMLSERIGDRTVVPHEVEHLLQNAVDARSDKSYVSQVLKETAKVEPRYDPALYWKEALQKSGTSKELREHLTKLGGGKIEPASYIGGLNPGEYSLREQFAELSAWEQALRKDLTKDPVVRREFFNNNDALISAYKGTTGLRTDRLDARDLSPMTAENAPSMMDRVRSILDSIGK